VEGLPRVDMLAQPLRVLQVLLMVRYQLLFVVDPYACVWIEDVLLVYQASEEFRPKSVPQSSDLPTVYPGVKEMVVMYGSSSQLPLSDAPDVVSHVPPKLALIAHPVSSKSYFFQAPLFCLRALDHLSRMSLVATSPLHQLVGCPLTRDLLGRYQLQVVFHLQRPRINHPVAHSHLFHQRVAR
jgi:hypothetical protein